jgi:hypothetical protein
VQDQRWSSYHESGFFRGYHNGFKLWLGGGSTAGLLWLVWVLYQEEEIDAQASLMVASLCLLWLLTMSEVFLSWVAVFQDRVEMRDMLFRRSVVYFADAAHLEFTSDFAQIRMKSGAVGMKLQTARSENGTRKTGSGDGANECPGRGEAQRIR